jgi:hypothetical protein
MYKQAIIWVFKPFIGCCKKIENAISLSKSTTLNYSYLLLLAALLGSCSSQKASFMNTTSAITTTTNTLTENEKKEGWQLLFDGTTTNGWHTYGKKDSIGKAWKVEDGTLRFDAASKKVGQTNEGGDIVTASEYGNFDLKIEWKIATGGNSGIMFYVKEDPKYPYPWHTGPEMQVLDNAAHSDAKIIKHRAGDLYDLISVSKETVKPAGEWNAVEIKAYNGQLQFYINGEEVLNTTLWDDAWRNLVAGSKFKDMPDFGTFKSGKIALQDHGDDVWFRNIKIRRL